MTCDTCRYHIVHHAIERDSITTCSRMHVARFAGTPAVDPLPAGCSQQEEDVRIFGELFSRGISSFGSLLVRNSTSACFVSVAFAPRRDVCRK